MNCFPLFFIAVASLLVSEHGGVAAPRAKKANRGKTPKGSNSSGVSRSLSRQSSRSSGSMSRQNSRSLSRQNSLSSGSMSRQNSLSSGSMSRQNSLKRVDSGYLTAQEMENMSKAEMAIRSCICGRQHIPASSIESSILSASETNTQMYQWRAKEGNHIRSFLSKCSNKEPGAEISIPIAHPNNPEFFPYRAIIARPQQNGLGASLPFAFCGCMHHPSPDTKEHEPCRTDPNDIVSISLPPGVVEQIEDRKQATRLKKVKPKRK